MTYYLDSLTIRADNSIDGQQQIALLWQDIDSGRLPLKFDSDNNLLGRRLLFACYGGYENGHGGRYNLTVQAKPASFLSYLERRVADGHFKKYEEEADDVATASRRVWRRVWQDSDRKLIKRAYSKDYEYSQPPRPKDGVKARCVLYISIF